jgi:predicted DNA-binding protein YlxM (UPF0122 family)
MQERGSSIPRDQIILCGDDSLFDHLVFEAGEEPETQSLDYYGIKSLEDFRMTDKQRQAIKEYFFNSKRPAQIAQELRISSEAVLDRIYHGKLRIVKQLNRRTLFNEYIRGVLPETVFGEMYGRLTNTYLAKVMIEVYFHDCEEAASVPGVIKEKHGIETTLGVVYKYVNVVKDYLDGVVRDEHKEALTNFSY